MLLVGFVALAAARIFNLAASASAEDAAEVELMTTPASAAAAKAAAAAAELASEVPAAVNRLFDKAASLVADVEEAVAGQMPSPMHIVHPHMPPQRYHSATGPMAAATAAVERLATVGASLSTLLMPPTPSSCCTSFSWMHRGALSADFVAYGLDATEPTAATLLAASDRTGIAGRILLSPHKNLATSFFGAATAADSLAGSLVFWSPSAGGMSSLTWDADSCSPVTVPANMTAAPAACVGDGTYFPTLIEHSYGDVLGPWFGRFSSVCGQAKMTVNLVSCMVTSITLNATAQNTPAARAAGTSQAVLGTHHHLPFPLWTGATGRIVLALSNSSAIPSPAGAFMPPERCAALYV